MTTVTFHKTKDGVIKGFQSKGHAGYANAGEDIVCASISILVINTINALEQLTEDGFQVEAGKLLQDLKEQQNLTYLFITHDLSVVKYISDRIGVMYLGNMVELAPTQELFDNPKHPYTEALMAAIPTTDIDADKELRILEGDIPSPVNPPKGCKFHTRCPYATDRCREEAPCQREVEPGHYVVCHLFDK